MALPKERVRFVPSVLSITRTTASLRPSNKDTRSPAIETNDAPTLVANRYEVLGRLGAGGFGVVYRVRDSSDGEMRALKIMPRIEGIGNLRLEFSSMARLEHPNIVRVFDYGVTEAGEDFFTMALVDGGDIRELAPDVTDPSFILLFRGLLKALAILHGQGVSHGDIKASNILVDSDMLAENPSYAAKLVDFGLAERVRDIADAETFKGTIGYAAPEVYVGQRDSRSDLYSLGILLYELVVGERPFRGKTFEVVRAQRAGPAPDPRQWNTALPAAISDLISGLTEPEPAARIQSAEDALRLLGEEVEGAADGEQVVSANGPLIGREDDLDRLRTAWQSAEDGAGRAILLHGEKGVGKTRLLNEFKLDVQVSGGLCYSVSAATEGALGRLAQRMVLDHSSEARTQDWELLLAPLWGGQASGTFDQEDTWALAEHFVALLTELSNEKPVLVLLDDLDHAEPAVADFLGYLMRSSFDERWLVVAASDAAYGRLYDSVVGNRAVQMLEIGALSDDETRNLLGALLGETAAGSIFTSVQNASAGNPANLQRCLQMLSEDAVIVRAHGSWLVRNAPSVLAMPEDLRAEVIGRLDRLDLRQRRVLANAAVIGERFELDTLEVLLTAQDRVSVATSLFAATRLSLLEEGDGFIRFRHRESRDELLKLLGTDEIRKIHETIVEYLQSRQKQGHPIVDGQLAEHAAAIGDAATALPAALLAAETARRMHSVEDEKKWLEKASTLCSRGSSHWSNIHGRLGDLGSMVGDIDASYAAYEIAIECAENPDTQARYMNRLAETLRGAGRGDESIYMLEKISTLSGVSATALGKAARGLARAYYFAGNYKRSIRTAETVLSQISGSPRLLAQLHYEIADAAMAIGDFERAECAVTESERYEPKVGHSARGRLLVHQGKYADAALVLDEVTSSRADHVAGEFRREQFTSLSDANNLGVARLFLGDWEGAAKIWSRARCLAEKLAERNQAAIVMNNLTYIYINTGRFDDAATLLADTRIHVKHTGDPVCRYSMVLTLADLDKAKGQLESAQQHYAEAEALLEGLGLDHERVEPAAKRLAIEVELNVATEAGNKLRYLLSLADAASDRARCCLVLRALSLTHRYAGDTAQADKTISDGLLRATELADPYEIALTLLEAAEVNMAMQRLGVARNKALEARTLLATIGARPMLKRVRLLLTQCDDSEPATVRLGQQKLPSDLDN